jgi:protein TonB
MHQRFTLLAATALLCACGTPPRDAPTTTASRSDRNSTSAPSASAAATSRTKSAAAASVSLAATPKAYRVDGAKHLYAVYADRIFKGKLPPLMHAIVITEVELDSAGNVRGIEMVRVPKHAPEVVVAVREMIRAASPLPAPQRMGGTRYTDIWLVDKSGRFQLDTLTEGQL